MDYKELDVWMEAKKLVKYVYSVTKSFLLNEQFSLTSQIKRSAISIPSNITEGCGRRTAKDTIQFLYVSRGSIYELETQLFLSQDLDYIKIKELEKIIKQVEICKKLLNGFINYYKKL